MTTNSVALNVQKAADKAGKLLRTPDVTFSFYFPNWARGGLYLDDGENESENYDESLTADNLTFTGDNLPALDDVRIRPRG